MLSNTKTLIIPISSLFFAIAFLAIGYGMILTFVGVYLKDSGTSDFIIGLINSAFFLGAILSSIFSQKIISAVGHIRSFATFASCMVIAFLLHAIFFNEALWAVLRFVSGFFTSFVALLFILLPQSSMVFYMLGFSLGMSIFCLYALSLARANDVLDTNKDIVEISRALLFSYGLGSFVAPIIIGVGLEFYGEFIFVIFAILGLFLGFYSLSRKRVADDDMSVFVNVPVASSSILPELDPRQDEEWVKQHN